MALGAPASPIPFQGKERFLVCPFRPSPRFGSASCADPMLRAGRPLAPDEPLGANPRVVSRQSGRRSMTIPKPLRTTHDVTLKRSAKMVCCKRLACGSPVNEIRRSSAQSTAEMRGAIPAVVNLTLVSAYCDQRVYPHLNQLGARICIGLPRERRAVVAGVGRPSRFRCLRRHLAVGCRESVGIARVGCCSRSTSRRIVES